MVQSLVARPLSPVPGVPELAPFAVTITYCAAGVTILDVAGELDLSTRSALAFRVAEVVREQGCCAKLILDLSRLSFCSAAGLSSLLQAQDIAHRRDIVMCLASTPRMDRVLSLTGLRDRFLTYPDLSTARADLVPPL